MSLRIALYGAGQHGRVVLSLLRQLTEFEPVVFIDDNPALHHTEIAGLPVAGSLDRLAEFTDHYRLDALFPSLAPFHLRRKLAEQADLLNLKLPTLIHPAAIIDPDTTIGRGVLIEAGACLTPAPIIADLCIINPLASVNHDCRLETAVHLAAGVVLGGDVWIGENTLVGVGAAIAPGIRIGHHCLIGAGAAVLRDVPDHSVVIGNPGRIRSRQKPRDVEK